MYENQSKNDCGAVPGSQTLESLKDYINANPECEDSEIIYTLKFQRFWLFLRLILLIPAMMFVGSIVGSEFMGLIRFFNFGYLFLVIFQISLVTFPFLALPALIMMIKQYGFHNTFKIVTHPFDGSYSVDIITDSSTGEKTVHRDMGHIMGDLIMKGWSAILGGVMLLCFGSIYGIYRNIKDVFVYNEATRSLGIESPITKNFWGLWSINGVVFVLLFVLYFVGTALDERKEAKLLVAATVSDNQTKIEVLTSIKDYLITGDYTYSINGDAYSSYNYFTQYNKDGNSYLVFDAPSVKDFRLYHGPFYLSQQNGVSAIFKKGHKGEFLRYTKATKPNAFTAIEKYNIITLCKFTTLLDHVDAVEVINPYKHNDWIYSGGIMLEFAVDDSTRGKISISTSPREYWSDNDAPKPIVDWDERRIRTFGYSENDSLVYRVNISDLADSMTDEAREKLEERLLAPTLLNSKLANKDDW